jgi:hypothetical protein
MKLTGNMVTIDISDDTLDLLFEATNTLLAAKQFIENLPHNTMDKDLMLKQINETLEG